MDKQKKTFKHRITPGVIVPCVCVAGVLTAAFTAFAVGSQVKEPDPVPVSAQASAPCDVHFAATQNPCPR